MSWLLDGKRATGGLFCVTGGPDFSGEHSRSLVCYEPRTFDAFKVEDDQKIEDRKKATSVR